MPGLAPGPVAFGGLAGVMVLIVVCSGGCASVSSPTDPFRRLAQPGAATPGGTGESPGSSGRTTAGDQTPAAIVDGEVVRMHELAPAMVEAGGAAALEDLVLARMLAREMQRRGIALGPDARLYEEQLFRSTIAASAPTSAHAPAIADRSVDAGVPDSGHSSVEARSAADLDVDALLRDLRARRGLGPVRYASLLDRSAMLRALVRAADADNADRSVVTDDDLAIAHELKFGERFVARLLVVPTRADADIALGQLQSRSFDEVARELSRDDSAQAGGLVAPISVVDPTYPVALRRALATMEPGTVSAPINVTIDALSSAGPRIRTGYCLAKLERRVPRAPNAPTLAAARESLKREIRLIRERAAMESLGQSLLQSADVRVMNSGLEWAWGRGRP
jgi:PPIC-type PPIASE domain